MKNFRPFSETFIEVAMPLDEKTIEALENSEQYAYLLDDLYSALNNPAYESVSACNCIGIKIRGGFTMFTARITFKSGNVLELSINSTTAESAKAVTSDYLKRKGFKPWNNIVIIPTQENITA